MSTNAYTFPCTVHPNCMINDAGIHIQGGVNDVVIANPPSHTGAVKSATPTPPSEDIDKSYYCKVIFRGGQPFLIEKLDPFIPEVIEVIPKAQLTSIMQAKQIEELQGVVDYANERDYYRGETFAQHRIIELRNNHG